ncbi:tripartite motif-containing protein 55-like [Saccostrea cucullata]|uniref:tripartite motif-containing protein 55-like n=1 Tax=Saccostrea cuccullata TaxID=36930 RepID=UPI002ED2E631
MDPSTSAQGVSRCEMCVTAMVQVHCDTCLVNLCKTCVGEHIISEETKDHKVRKFTPFHPGCISHIQERCEMYCNQCDIPICKTCIAFDQHIGHKSSTILEILDEKKNKIIQEQNELKETVFPTYQDIASDVQNRMSQLEKEYEDISKTITEHGEDWHRNIDKLVKKLKAEVDEMKNTQLQTLQKHLDEIKQTFSNMENDIESVNIIVKSNDFSKLVGVQIDVDRYKKLPHKIVPSLPKFMPGKIQGEELSKNFGALSSMSLTFDKHGYSMKTTQKSPEAGSSPPVKQLLDEPETVTTIDTDYILLNDVACQSDEEIWTSGDDSTMKLYSIIQGSLLKSITTKSGNKPFDIEVTKSGDLIYTDYGQIDTTVNIVKKEKIEEVIRLQQNWKPDGVCSTSSGDILLIQRSDDGNQTKVVRYSGSTEKQTIQFDDEGKPLYSLGFCIFPKCITENRNLDICVSDQGAKAVVVVNQAGKLRFRYTGHTPAPKNQWFDPVGITSDSQCHILTADMYNDCVHIIDQDGQFLRYIQCGLSQPKPLCTDTNDNLFVVQYSTTQVKKIKYLQ